MGHDGAMGGFDGPPEGRGGGGANVGTTGESSSLGGATSALEGGVGGSTSDGDASGPKFTRTVSFADSDFYVARSGGPVGTESYVFAAILRASEGTTEFTNSVQIWRKGATARGWTFSRLSGTSVRFRHHDAAGIARGTSVPIHMDRLNVVVFTFDGATQVGYVNGVPAASKPIVGITPAVELDDFFIPGSASEPNVLIADVLWSNAPGGFLDASAVSAWTSTAIAATERGEVPPGWMGCEGHFSAVDAGDSTWADRIGGLTLTLKRDVILKDVPAVF
jgi:hypothetical protein